MSYTAYFLLGLVLRVSTAEFCFPIDSIFDKGLEKVLLSERFSEIPLPDMARRLEGLFGTSVSVTGGRLTGLQSIKRNGQNVLHAGKSGSRLSFHVKGGPLDAYYVGRLRSVLLRKSFRLGARVPTFEASFTAEERSPNRVHLQVHGVRMSRIRLRLGGTNIGSYDFITELIRPSIEEKIGEILARELRSLAEKTLGAVKVYAAKNGEGSDPVRAWRKAFNSASAYLSLLRSPDLASREDDSNYYDSQEDSEESWPSARRSRRREHRSASREREQWVFDGCLSKLVVSTGFEPAPLPEDLEDFSCTFGRVSVSGGNVTGLSSVHTTGDNVVKLGECGLSARFHLGFNDLIVSGLGSVTNYISTSFAFDVRIPAVEVILEIAERYKKLEIVHYELDFTAPVNLTATSLGAVGSVVNWFGGVPERSLESSELEQLKNASRKYVEQVVHNIGCIIEDPPVINMF